VRDKDEALQGMLIGAVNIPVGHLKEKAGEIPKDKEIIVHCVTGIRAEQAQKELKAMGFKARFLNAVIQIDANGNFVITEK